jgi:hypothetical protein
MLRQLAATVVLVLALAATAAGAPRAMPTEETSAGILRVLHAPPDGLPRQVQAGVFGPMSLLYVKDDAVRLILGASQPMQSLPWIFRQEPTTSGPGATLGTGNGQRMVKVSGAALVEQQTAAGMAGVLRGAVDRTCTTPAGVSTCLAHRVIVDELDSRFGGRGGRPSPVGQRLHDAMAMLSREAAPWGGSYAGRVHFAVAPGPATSVAAGYGPNRTLGRNGLPIRRNYRAAFAALSLSGGAWIQMYHYSRGGGVTGYTPAEWRDVPVGIASFLERLNTARDPLSYMHFLVAQAPGDGPPPGGPCSTPGIPGGPTVPAMPVCVPVPTACEVLPWRYLTSFPAYGRARVSARAAADGVVARRAEKMLVPVGAGAAQVIRQPQASPMACQWSRAQSGAVNTRILMNGPGAYALGGNQAVAWGAMFRQFFQVP